MSDQDGGIMQKILTITAPPHTNTTSKQRRSKQPRTAQVPATRQTGIDNRPYCEACGDGGDLLCCERCPSSFHFTCCDPPLDPLNLPEGEWVCQGCRPTPAHLEEHPNTIFRPLLMQCCSENPMVFSLPEELMNVVALRDVKQERRIKQESSGAIKFCYVCNQSSRLGRIISCDFCPLSFHMDCLTPPLPDRPISSSWMCPNHVEHRISDLQDARLTKRIEALEKCRSEISRQAIKMDFLKTINRIPHYQRNLIRSNRRASDVPMAIKAMYNEPLNDSYHAPCLTDLLMTASEELETLRKKGEMERETISRQITPPPTITTTSEECDKWTRHTVVSRVVPTSSSIKLNGRSTAEDLKDILGVTDLDTQAPPTCNGFASDDDMETNETLNQPVHNTTAPNRNKHLNGLVGGTGPGVVGGTGYQSNNFIPDVSQLDSDLVKLLAEQRLRELFAEQKTPSHDSHMTATKQINHVNNKSLQQAANLSQDIASPLGIVCPVSSYGPAHLLKKRIITIGSSSNMDIPLNEYGHCNFISAHHACLILDKDTSENELINYSEHGSIVDGVLYSCDFSDKMSSSDGVGGPTPLLLDDIMARGTGIRAEKARRRLDASRKSLQEKSQAAKALSAAYKLSKSIVKEFTPDPSVVAGLKRRRSFDVDSSTSPTSPGNSSIVSIPLSKTKKTTNNRTNDKYLDKKKSSPEKKHQPSTAAQPVGHKPANYIPCLCKRSASSLIGTGGKGWEGAAMISHGSKLRFGCIQFVLSLNNKPGYNELHQALKQHNLL